MSLRVSIFFCFNFIIFNNKCNSISSPSSKNNSNILVATS